MSEPKIHRSRQRASTPIVTTTARPTQASLLAGCQTQPSLLDHMCECEHSGRTQAHHRRREAERKFTVITFFSIPRHHHTCFVQTDSKYCHRLATIIDKQTRVSNDVTVCSGRRQHHRSVSHVTADSATVEVRLYSPSTTSSHNAGGDSFGAASLPHSLLRYEGRSIRPNVSGYQAV